MNNINIAIVGLGNCTASLVMGLSYYKNVKNNDNTIPGLVHPVLGGYKISDIKIVACFDVDKRKVGKNIIDAIFSEPNCTKQFEDTINMKLSTDCVTVLKGPVLDGIADHMKDYFQVDDNQKELSKKEIVSILKERNTDILISYLPVGSQLATEFWADIALESRCAFINAIPVFIASNEQWANKFKQANIPIIGDDIKSMVGSTITSRYIIQMLIDRGAKIDSMYQTNIGGNTDFRNMTDLSRLISKKISKTESIKSLIPYDIPIFAGPNGCIDSLLDNKISYMRIDFKIFGNIDCHIDIKLDVEDSPNSGGIMVDAIRIAKIALDRKIGGSLIGPCAYYMKHPIEQYADNTAYQMVKDFINNYR